MSTLSPAEAKALTDEALTDELAKLSIQQSEALQRAAYLNMSKSDAAAYDERRERIAKIWLLLRDYRA